MKDNDLKPLLSAILSLKTENDLRAFLTDLCTPKELEAFIERWEIARLLHDGTHGYREIAQMTGASTTTVTRVARFLNQESYGGYRQVLSTKKK